MPDMNPAPADPAELAPPPEPSLLTALPWAIGAHVALLLVFALLSMSWRRSEEQSEAIEAEIWAASVQQALAGQPDMPVLLAADKNLPYQQVMSLMGRLREAGVQRIALSVK